MTKGVNSYVTYNITVHERTTSERALSEFNVGMFRVAPFVFVFLFLGCVIGDPCIDDPLSHSCMSYTYPSGYAASDLVDLCLAMPQMSGCSLYRKCVDGKISGDKICDDPFTLVTWICAGDSMGGMGGCRNYTSLCKQGSMVQQCKLNTPESFPTTMMAKQIALGLCDQMEMSQCSSCSSSKCNDAISTFSSVCLSMDMEGCDSWRTMCTSLMEFDPSAVLVDICGESKEMNDIYPMKMYFHGGTREIILFKGWKTSEPWIYWMSFFAIIATGIYAGWLRYVFRGIERRWAQSNFIGEWKSDALNILRVLFFVNAVSSCRNSAISEKEGKKEPAEVENDTALSIENQLEKGNSGSGELQVAGTDEMAIVKKSLGPLPHIYIRSVRAFFAGLIMIFSYWLMLIAMTFNTGLFFAVIIGWMSGVFIFGHDLVLQDCCSV